MPPKRVGVNAKEAANTPCPKNCVTLFRRRRINNRKWRPQVDFQSGYKY